jgi:hypothetical protein
MDRTNTLHVSTFAALRRVGTHGGISIAVCRVEQPQESETFPF